MAIQNAHGDKRRKLDQAGLTALLAEPLPPKGKTRVVFDTEIPSFAVRISPEGNATFVMVYSFGGRIRKFTIGRFRQGDMAKQVGDRGLSAALARRQALVLRARIEQGEDIAAAKSAAREQEKADRAARAAAVDHARRKSEYTLEALLGAYVDHLRQAGKPSAGEVERAIKRAIVIPYPKVAKMPADEVTVEAVMPVFHALAKAGKFREAEKLRAYLRAAYTAARKGRTDAAMHAFSGFQIRFNPLEDLAVTRPKEAAAAAKERKWAITEAQLAAYWRRISAIPAPHGALLRFHLLTGGQRVEQLSRLTAADYDADAKTVILYDTKGRRQVAHEHVVPLLPEAERAIAEMRGDRGPYLFTLSAGKDGAVYHSLRDAILHVAQAMIEAGEIDRTFTPGIIRKTVETRLAALGVPKDIRGRLQSHGVGGVQDKHYDAHDYDKEKRDALRKLRQLCEGTKGGKVVPLRRRAS